MYAAILAMALAPQFGVQEIIEKVEFTGAVITKEERIFSMPDGRKMRVPIINGLVPKVNEYTDDQGVIHRTFNYDKEVKFRDENQYVEPPKLTDGPPKLPPVPVTKTKPSDKYDELSKSMEDVRQKLKLVEKSFENKMKRPSEIKDPDPSDTRAVPKY